MGCVQGIAQLIRKFDTFVLAAGFDQAAVTQVATEPQIALCRAQNQLDGPVIEGVAAKPYGGKFASDVALQILVVERQQRLWAGDAAFDVTPPHRSSRETCSGGRLRQCIQ